MASERLKRQIDRLLDEAEQAFVSRDWDTVRRCAQDVLAFDPDNPDASGLLAGAERALGTETAITGAPQGTPVPLASPSQPTSFANGRSQVKRFLGEGGKKKVYSAHDSTLDRDVGLAVIKAEGLDDASRARATREARAMGRLGDHPNILQIPDLGEDNDQPYLVLPLMPGILWDEPWWCDA